MSNIKDYKNTLVTILTYYMQELISIGDIDPTKTIIEDFVDAIEITNEQKQFILDEKDNFKINVNNYIDEIIKLLDILKENPSKTTTDDIKAIISCMYMVKKNIMIDKSE